MYTHLEINIVYMYTHFEINIVYMGLADLSIRVRSVLARASWPLVGAGRFFSNGKYGVVIQFRQVGRC